MAQSEQRWVKLNIPLVDEWFRVTKLPSDAIVLALHILRRMLAWNKTRDTIGVSQLMAATHMPVAELAVLLDRIAPPIRKRQALKSANQPAQKGSNGNSTKHQ